MCIAELTGGPRQRIWITMVHAQQTDFILLDELTSSLNIAYPLDILSLVQRIEARGRTVILVIHDINQAARYADQIVVMADGHNMASVAPSDIITRGLLRDVFHIETLVEVDSVTDCPIVSVQSCCSVK